jgi:hypothetical protein
MVRIRLYGPFRLSAVLRLSFLVVLLSACASAQVTTTTEPAAADTETPVVALPTLTAAVSTLEPATQPASTEEAAALPVATSRGPDLHATDPTTVSLASGGLQFVEFFRFT